MNKEGNYRDTRTQAQLAADNREWRRVERKTNGMLTKLGAPRSMLSLHNARKLFRSRIPKNFEEDERQKYSDDPLSDSEEEFA